MFISPSPRLSLLAYYLPGFSPWFDSLEPNLKRLLMLLLIALAAVVSYSVACAGWGGLVDPLIACNTAGAGAVVKAFIANQAAYLITPRRS